METAHGSGCEVWGAFGLKSGDHMQLGACDNFRRAKLPLMSQRNISANKRHCAEYDFFLFLFL